MKRLSNISLYYSAGFLPAIFRDGRCIGSLYLDGVMVNDHNFDGHVLVLDTQGEVVSDKFDGDVCILTVTNNDYRDNCKVPGGSSKGIEKPQDTLMREIPEEAFCHIRKSIQFRREIYGGHSRNFFVIDGNVDLGLNQIRFSSTGGEKLKVYWLNIINFSCCLFKNQRSAFKQLVQILSRNQTFANRYRVLVEVPFVDRR
jgi:hypothetical protein